MGGSNSGLPSLNLPSFAMPSINPTSIATTPNQVYSLLAQSPPSLTNTLAPLLSSVFGTQANLMQPLFQQQGAQGAAQAQSDAMKRGLTGSSIEAANMTQAYTGANAAYDQYLAQQLNALVPIYANAVGTDVGNTQNYYSQLAQAVGQQLASQIAQQEFQQQLQAGLSQAGMMANSQLWSGIAGGLGSAAGGALMHFSDVRLKQALFPLFRWRGLTMFLFQYDQAKLNGLPRGTRVGFLAHEVAKTRPDCVALAEGYLKVNYPKLFGLRLRTQEA